ncbi:MAG: hypothetical protein QOE70_2414 [Chthoniobacter sp.]|jgi:hypothetical protein|nr:hypothetical protein [Chthoniobacter sp.]
MKQIALRAWLALILSLLLTVAPKAFGAAQVTVSFDTGTKKVFADAAHAAALGSGSSADGDGCVVELGYYNAANAGHPFAGEWVALTGESSRNVARTSIGDSAGAGPGTVAFSLTFVAGSSATGNNLPATETPLAVRFYNARTIAAATRFNVASSGTWRWREPQPAPANPVVNLSLDDAGLEWLDGAGSAFVTSQSTGHVAPLAGTYQALVTTAPGSAQRGTLRLRLLDSGGTFSAVLAWAGHRYPLRGVLDAEGRWQGLVSQAGRLLRVDLRASKDQLDGNVTFADGTVSSLSGARLWAPSFRNPSPREGAYTLLLVPSGDTATSSPTPPGFAAMTVSALGAVHLQGVLPDGTPFSRGAQLLSDDRLLLDLPSADGGVFGEIVFRDQPQISDADGDCHWANGDPPGAQLHVIASKYDLTAPVLEVNTSVAAQASGNLELTISGAGYEPALARPATLTPSNHLFVLNSRSYQTSLSLVTGSGIFRGSFTNGSGHRVSFSGAIFQKQQLGAGLFRDGAEIGGIELTATGN